MNTLMNFNDVAKRLSDNFDRLVSDQNVKLFEVAADKDAFWRLYLDSFPAGTNPIYRVRSVHDCVGCRHFLKDIGLTVTIDDDLNVHSIFDFDAGNENYQVVMDALAAEVKKHPIRDRYFAWSADVGTACSRERGEDGSLITFEHFNVRLPDYLVVPDELGLFGSWVRYSDNRDGFKRSLDEISEDAVLTVLEMISDGSLNRVARGAALLTFWADQLKSFLKYKQSYDKLDGAKKDLFCWKYAGDVDGVIAHLQDYQIGVLLTDITNGMVLDEAVRKLKDCGVLMNFLRWYPF